MREVSGVTLTNTGLLPVVLPNKLDLGCGPNKKPGFCGVDQIPFPGVDMILDLRKPWPWENNSIYEVHCSHTLEHFDGMERVHFLNELYRVLMPGDRDASGKPAVGFCTLIVPHWASCRAYGDPTHKWPPVSEFGFFYWKRDWRMANAPHDDAHPRGLDPHNNGGKTGEFNPDGFNCNFDVTWVYTLEPGTAARNSEFQQFAMQYYTEARQDIIATLIKI